jgi:predicted Zn-dependent peptidase
MIKEAASKYLRLIMASILVFICHANNVLTQEKFRYEPPNPLPLPSLQLPKIQTAVLSNQLGLSVVRKIDSPFMEMRMIIRTGESLSPDSRPGLATFTAQMMTKGTAGMSSSELNQKIESMGGSLTIETFPDHSVFELSFLNDYLEPAIELLAQLMIKPDFSRTDIDRTKRELYYHITEEDSSAEIRSKKLLYNVLFENHPYRKFALDSEAVKLFERNDVLEFYRQFYCPNNAHLMISGDLSLSTASRLVSRYFNVWEPIQMDRYRFTFPKPKKDTRICFTDTPRTEDAVVHVGFVLPPKSKETYFPVLVMNQVLGGTSTSRFFMNLRESKRYAYWAFSAVEYHKNCGVFLIQARIRGDVIKESVNEIMNEIRRMKSQEIPIQELELAKSYLLGHFPVELSTPAGFNHYLMKLSFFNLNSPFWEDYFENIMLVNSEMVYQAAQSILDRPPVVCIAGDLDNLIESMKEFDEVEVYDASGKLSYTLTNR